MAADLFAPQPPASCESVQFIANRHFYMIGL